LASTASTLWGNPKGCQKNLLKDFLASVKHIDYDPTMVTWTPLVISVESLDCQRVSD